MRGKITQFFILLATAVSIPMLLWIPTSQARTVYQYIDQNGAMAFSDSPPAHTDNYQVLELPDAPDPDPAQLEQNIDDMIAVTEKLEARRREAEQARAREQEEPQPPAVIYYPVTEGYDGGYGYPGYYWGGYPGGNRAAPPYRYKNIHDPVARQIEDMRTPLRIPGFGTGGTLQERIQPYNPPPKRPAGPPRPQPDRMRPNQPVQRR